MRHETITQEVPKEQTGMRGKCFVHVDHIEGRVTGVRMSEKGKDFSTLDRLFTALGDTITDIVQEVQG